MEATKYSVVYEVATINFVRGMVEASNHDAAVRLVANGEALVVDSKQISNVVGNISAVPIPSLPIKKSNDINFGFKMKMIGNTMHVDGVHGEIKWRIQSFMGSNEWHLGYSISGRRWTWNDSDEYYFTMYHALVAVLKNEWEMK